MAAHIEARDETPDPALPTLTEVLERSRTKSLGLITRDVVEAFAQDGHTLSPLELSGWPSDLRGFVELFRTQLPNPLVPDQRDLEYIIAVTAGKWTSARTDAFIANMAPLRLGAGLPIVHLYSPHEVPAEVQFLFETMDAGVLELSAWEVVDEEPPEAVECAEVAEIGRRLLRDIYYVDLDPMDLQWVSVVNQLVIEELRYFTDDPTEAIDGDEPYVPFASLLVLGCVAGEAIRLNHEGELVWADGDGQNTPRIGHVGSVGALPILEETLRRFELGESHDVWESYQTFYTAEKLSPPLSFEAGNVNPLDFLPDWEPLVGDDIDEAAVEFVDLVRQLGLELHPQPVTPRPEDAPVLSAALRAYSCVQGETRYDLFVCAKVWDEELTRAFLRTYSHYAMQDWELGRQPTFVFFSAAPLSPPITYAFVEGPTVAPLEGITRTETPAPAVAGAAPEVVRTLAHWLLALLERYTTIGLELSSYSVLPGLEFFLKEDLRDDYGEEDDAGEGEGDDFEPEALLVAVGLTAGEHIRLATRSCRWVQPTGSTWPVMEIDGREGSTFDWVATARAIWRGEREDFGWRSSWTPQAEPSDDDAS